MRPLTLGVVSVALFALVPALAAGSEPAAPPARTVTLATQELPAVAALGTVPDRDLYALRHAAAERARALLPPGACAVEDDHFRTEEGGCKDLVTGLVWSKCTVDNEPGSFSHTYQGAIDYCDSLVEDGYDDWFLPSKDELLEVAAHEGTDSGDAWHFNWTPLNAVQRSSNKKGGWQCWVVSITTEAASIDHVDSLRTVVCARNGSTDPGGGATAVHVEAIALSTQNAGQGNKRGRAQVTVLDDLGQPVQGAQVTGTFAGDYTETVNDSTDSNGVAVLTTAGTASGGISFGFCVDDVALTGLTYDAAANVETCDGY